MSKERISQGKMNKSRFLNNSIYVSYMIFFAAIIVLTRIIGVNGAGILCVPMISLFICISLLSYTIASTMSGLIRYRVKRGQFSSASYVYHMAMRYALIYGAAVCVLLFFFAGKINSFVLLDNLTEKIILVIIPSLFLGILICIIRGFFTGQGFGAFVSYSYFIEMISFFIFACVFGKICMTYGANISNLIITPSVAYAFGALGVCIGIFVAKLITLLCLFAIYLLNSRTFYNNLKSDNGRRVDSRSDISVSLLTSGLIPGAIVFLSNIIFIFDQKFFNLYMINSGTEGDKYLYFGSFIGKYLSVCAIFILIAICFANSTIKRIVSSYDREDYSMMRERIWATIKKILVMCVPLVVFVAVLSEPLLLVIFDGESTLAVPLLTKGTIVILLMPLTFFFVQLLLKLRYLFEALIATGVSAVLHIVFSYIFVVKSQKGLDGLIISFILYFACYFVLSFAFVCLRLSYRPIHILSVGFVLLGGCISGVLVLLINKAVISLMPAIGDFIVCFLLGVFIYMLILTILKVFTEEELERMPLGSVFVFIGRLIGCF